MALLSHGADGKTYDELKNGLHFKENKISTANGFKQYIETLQENAGEAKFTVANHVFVQKGHQINQNFRDVAVNQFWSGIESLDFAKSEESSQTINTWVEQKTNGLIKNLTNPNMLNAGTRVFLTNAIYFKGVWEDEFDAYSTQKQKFYRNEQDTIETDFMSNEGTYDYAVLNDLDATAVGMRYKNSNFSFIIVLPNNRTGLPILESQLRNSSLERITSQMQEQDVRVTIPKFKAEYEINLNDVLTKVIFLTQCMKVRLIYFKNCFRILDGHG